MPIDTMLVMINFGLLVAPEMKKSPPKEKKYIFPCKILIPYIFGSQFGDFGMYLYMYIGQ